MEENQSGSGKVCQYCGRPLGTEMPFRCKYCSGSFCSEHRLPESHKCGGLKQVKERVARGEMPMFPEKRVAREIKPKFSSSYGGLGGLKDKIKNFFRKLKSR
ncbi:MAG: hypothetical protein JSV92_01410 [archaeon]|nr:MAG: hypothetical protein JSV92_01410 [archaeon]